MRTHYHFEAGPVGNAFYARLIRLPVAVYTALAVAMAFALAASTVATGTLSGMLLKPVSDSNPQLGNLLTLLGTFGLLWVVYLVWAVPNRFRASGMHRRRIGMLVPLGLVLGLALSAGTAGMMALGFGTRFSFDGAPLGDPMFWVMGAALLLAYTVQGGAEELVFRSMVPAFLARRANALTIVVAMSAGFSAAHFSAGAKEPLVFLYTFLLGVFFGLLVIASNSLWIAIVAHGAYNFGGNYLMQLFHAAPGGSPLAAYLAPASVGLIGSVVMLFVLRTMRPGWHRESLHTLADRADRALSREEALV